MPEAPPTAAAAAAAEAAASGKTALGGEGGSNTGLVRSSIKRRLVGEDIPADTAPLSTMMQTTAQMQKQQEQQDQQQQQEEEEEEMDDERGGLVQPLSAVQLAAGVASPALFSGQAGAASLELMPDTEEQVAMLPNCMAKQYAGQYGAAQCPSAASFPFEMQGAYRWRITPVKVARKKGFFDEHLCVVEKIPGSVPVSPEAYTAAVAAAAAGGDRDLTMLWLVIGIVGITILLATVACLTIRCMEGAATAVS
ncbi:hypothetical protein ACSSS7_004252 [Eimeria intestinalis]